jgi:excinuclease UvrABC ATPase subunit
LPSPKGGEAQRVKLALERSKRGTGNTLDVIKTADWLIDMGPGGGAGGGTVVGTGTPEDIAANARSHTNKYWGRLLPR